MPVSLKTLKMPACFRSFCSETVCILVCQFFEHHDLLISRINRHPLDELMSVYVVLRTTCQDELRLNFFLSQLSISIEAFAFSAPKPTSGQAEGLISQSRDLVWSNKITNEPLTIEKRVSENDDSSFSYVIWKTDAFLRR